MSESFQPVRKHTPMMEQYFSIKKEYPDALLFYRLGDFYELFFADAELASRELQITLTSRQNYNDKPIPMCGVPYHSAENYLTQLFEKGYKVAICEQMEDPKEAKGLVKRAVVQVRTPGTSVEDGTLSAKSHNYLGAVYWNADTGAGGFAWLEFSTGEWCGIFSKKETDLWQWVQKMQPKELLLPDLPLSCFRLPQNISLDFPTPVRLPLRSYFEYNNAVDRVLKAQQVQELGALGLQDKSELVSACGALLAYAFQTQKQELTHLRPFTPLNLSKHLIIDEITERNLEIFKTLDGKKGPGTLWHILDNTLTPMGGRLLEERLRHPWRELDLIREMHDAVDYFLKNNEKRFAIRSALKQVYDLERLSTRIHLGRAGPKDFVALKLSFAALPQTLDALSAPPFGQYAKADEAQAEDAPVLLQKIIRHWDNFEDAYTLLETSLTDSPPLLITEGGLFKAGYSFELDELLDLLDHGEQHLQDILSAEQKTHNLPKLKLGCNRVFGYYFEHSRTNAPVMPAHFIRKQTIANAERYITPELKTLEEKIIAAEEKKRILEHRMFLQLREKISLFRPRILLSAALIAQLDVIQSLAETAQKRDWNQPVLQQNSSLIIKGGRHPVVEHMVGSSRFIANDLIMDETRKLILITGPNMAGKSTVLRQVALICILAQIGSFVPASSAHLGYCDRIFSRVGASDNLAHGHSTFMIEMMETARILRQSTKRSLVILDEIGRGTSTLDGLSLAWAVVEELLKRGDGTIRTLFATHYHELTALEGRLPGLHNMNIAIKEHGNEILFLRKLIPGPADKSYGIEVARLAGVPQGVVQRAKKVLSLLEAAKKNHGANEASTAMQQLLPGMEHLESDPIKDTLLPEKQTEPMHPFLITLHDLDTNSLTPIQALTLINEWKILWGGVKNVP